ncbi:MAG: hypothetical protein OXF27_21005 [Acidobacteria bacterium]|nr:hypothetical protein [Acidobacteriota bacterium]
MTVTGDGGLQDGVGGTTSAITTPTGYDPAHTLVIDDDETQTYVLTLAPTHTAANPPTEQQEVTVNLTAMPAHTSQGSSGELTLDLDPTVAGLAVGGIAGNAATVTTAAQVITFTPGGAADAQPNGDGNRVTDTYTLTVYSGNAVNSDVEATLDIPVVDIHPLPMVDAVLVDAQGRHLDPQPTSVEEGSEVNVVFRTYTVNATTGQSVYAGDDENLTVRLDPTGDADAADYSLVQTISIPTTATDGVSSAVALEVRSDEDVGEETLAFDAVVSGNAQIGSETETSEGVISLTITDATEKKIQPKSETDAYPSIQDPMAEAAGDDGLNPGESFMVSMDDLFTLMDGYTATYGANSEGSAVSISERGDVLTIEAEESGTSKVTVTGTASVAASSFAPSQTISNVAHIAFEVMVVDTELVVTLAADPMEIEEGGTSTITAMANRAVVAGDGDVTINLSVVGDGTLDADSIMIAMDEMSGSAMLTAADNSDYGENDPVTVVASGSGIDGQVSIAVSVMDNDEAPVEPEPTNSIEANPQDDAYPIITAAIEAGAGEEGFNPGESAMVDAAELFTVMEGYTATYAASVEGEAASTLVSGSHVTVTAEMLGEAKVTITGTATAASSSFEAGQPAINVATVTFPVMVDDKGLRITLHAPDNVMEGNLVEGQSYTLTVQANRVVREDTMVSFGRDRSMSDADEGTDYELNDVTMLAGSDSVKATLDVLEDMEPDAGTDDNMGEALVIYAMAGDAQSDDLHLTIWDQAVPSLPLIGQLLLALFLMLGGARLYRRRQG